MPKNCVICKTNPAELTAKIKNKETGEFSAAIPLCEECLNRISKTRQVEIIPDASALPTPKVAGPAPDNTNSQPISDDAPKKTHAVQIAAVIMLLVGIACIIVGIVIKVPNSHLVDILDSNPYMQYNGIQFRPGYSTVEKIVGVDAYNFIIGASLVGGYISGRIVQKTIFVVSGIIISLAGLLALCVMADRQK